MIVKRLAKKQQDKMRLVRTPLGSLAVAQGDPFVARIERRAVCWRGRSDFAPRNGMPWD